MSYSVAGGLALYAVVDVETTGMRLGWHDRVTEIAVVTVDGSGQVTDEWATLVNPDRDLGPQRIHGIQAVDVRHAPAFSQIVAPLSHRLRGRLLVAHNLPFDVMFLRAEFERLGLEFPIDQADGLCTMQLATRFLPGAPRSLAGCCAFAGVPLRGHHDAAIDAQAAAALLRLYLERAGDPKPWSDLLNAARRVIWPRVGEFRVECVRRGVSARLDTHFLTRIVDRLPRILDSPQADSYLAMLDRALLDRHISAHEGDALVLLAAELGLDRPTVSKLHGDYLTALAQAAWQDGVVTSDERQDLCEVATALGLGFEDVDQALLAASIEIPARGQVERFKLQPGDLVVFTGDMDEPREFWHQRAVEAGLVPHTGINRRVRLVVAQDPDSLSGKAKKARKAGIPLVDPEHFATMLQEMLA